MKTLFLLLGQKRYDMSDLRKWLHMLDRAIIEIGETTPLGQDLINRGLERGLERGREEGRVRTVRLIRGFLRRVYPKLAEHSAIDKVPTLERADQLLDQLYLAESEHSALAAIMASGVSDPVR